MENMDQDEEKEFFSVVGTLTSASLRPVKRPNPSNENNLQSIIGSADTSQIQITSSEQRNASVTSVKQERDCITGNDVHNHSSSVSSSCVDTVSEGCDSQAAKDPQLDTHRFSVVVDNKKQTQSKEDGPQAKVGRSLFNTGNQENATSASGSSSSNLGTPFSSFSNVDDLPTQLAIQFLAQKAAQQALATSSWHPSSFPSESTKHPNTSTLANAFKGVPYSPSPGRKKRQRTAISLEEESLSSQSPSKRKQRSFTHTGVRTCVCEICNAVLSAPASLKTHMLIHSGDKPYPCVLCSAAFRHQSTLKRHMCIHTGEKKFLCEICQSPFARKTELTQHQRSHSTARPFICKLCGSSYKHPKDLSQHLRAHARTASYPCGVCSSSFDDPTSLNAHLKTHKDSKPHRELITTLSCDVCDTKFNSLVSLTQHVMKNHLTDLPAKSEAQAEHALEETSHQCSMCGFSFDSADLLTLHFKESHWTEHLKSAAQTAKDSWSGEYACKICFVKLPSSSALGQHIKKKHWFSTEEAAGKDFVKAHTCTMCGMEYPRLKSLAQHMKKSHSINLLPCAKCGSTFMDMQDWVHHTDVCA